MPKPFVALDFETGYNKKDYSVTKLGNWSYAHDPRFDPYMISVADENESWAGHPKDFNWAALEGKEIVAWNKGFDHNVWKAMAEKGIAPQLPNHWHCAANLSAYLCNRRALKDGASFLLGVQVEKGIRDWMNGKNWADAVAGGKDKELLAYARGDARNTFDVWAKYADLWPAHERELSEITYDYCDYGINIDLPLLEGYIKITQAVLIKLELALPWIARGNKPTSPKGIAEECRMNCIPSPPVKSHEDGEENYSLWEATYGPKFPWIGAYSNWRSLNKFLSTLETVKMRIRPDGTINFGLKYFGAHTGRWSGDNGFNLLNLRKDPIFIDKDFMPITDDIRLQVIADCLKEKQPLPSWVIEALDIRKILIPRAGKKFICSDLSQIEPRVLAWLAGDFAMLDKVRQGFGIYEAAAISRGLYSGEKGKFKQEKKKYAMVKANVLALGYQCGAERYIEAAKIMAGYDVCQNDDIDPLTGEKIYGSAAKREVEIFRKENPKTVALWNRLDREFKSSAGGDYVIELPSGRKMTYRKVRREVRKVFNPKTETYEPKFVFTGECRGRREMFYGGLLTENTTQATARDVFAEMVLDAHKKTRCPLFHVYDEIIHEVDKDVTTKDIEASMSITPAWLEGCPIGAEAQESMHYLK